MANVNEVELLSALRSNIRGPVLAPGDAQYDTVRKPWNIGIDQNPCAVVQPSADSVADDVSATIRAASAGGFQVAVQGTGHGATGLVDSRTVLISMSHLRNVALTGDSATVAPGARWVDVVDVAAEQGLAGLAGSSVDVGVVGYSLGGGLGWLARQYGLAVNSVRGAQIVTADGNIHRVDAATEPELFWGLRGGAANIGIVTALDIALFPVSRLHAGALTWPAEKSGDVFAAYVDWCRDLPDAVTPTAMLVTSPSGPFAYIGLCSTLSADETRDVVSPLRALGPTLSDSLRERGPAELADIHGDPLAPTASVSDARLVSDVPAGTARTLARYAPGPDSALAMLEMRCLGGALARSDPEHGALERLEGDFLLFTLGIADVTGTRAAIDAAIDDVLEAMAPFESGRSALNFVDRPVSGQSEFTPAAYQRLQKLRSRVDPAGTLRANHPITQPSPG